jgi:LuxR family maltose regulon positive regulatory protein
MSRELILRSQEIREASSLPPAYRTALLQTRLHPPRLQADTVARPRLDALFQRATQAKVLLVTAPAGYGKTYAALMWLKRQSSPVAWLSLTSGHDDLYSFVAYFVAALQQVAPGVCANTAQLAFSAQAPARILLATLVNELAVLDRPVVLILDDYGSVAAQSIHAFMTALIDVQPPTLHLVLTTRANPPLPLARWRASHELAEIRAADLRCDETETGALLTAKLGAPTPAALVDTIHARTEGWVAGLRLTAISLRRKGPEQLVAGLAHASTTNVRDYLMEEVFFGQSAEIQDFLLKTSILERFCAPLCAALVAGPGQDGPATGAARAMIDYLVRAGLFVNPLDEQDEWYRYHSIFVQN